MVSCCNSLIQGYLMFSNSQEIFFIVPKLIAGIVSMEVMFEK